MRFNYASYAHFEDSKCKKNMAIKSVLKVKPGQFLTGIKVALRRYLTHYSKALDNAAKLLQNDHHGVNGSKVTVTIGGLETKL